MVQSQVANRNFKYTLINFFPYVTNFLAYRIVFNLPPSSGGEGTTEGNIDNFNLGSFTGGGVYDLGGGGGTVTGGGTVGNGGCGASCFAFFGYNSEGRTGSM